MISKVKKYLKNIAKTHSLTETKQIIKKLVEHPDLTETEFYPADIFVWANVKYADFLGTGANTETILKYALNELTDADFPFYPASQKAYCWLKKHIENDA